MATKEQLERAAPRDRGGDLHLRSGPQLREYHAAADRIAADRPRRLLDWGCGYGQLSHLLKARGIEVESMEWDPEIPEGTVRPLERYPDVVARYTQEPVRLPYEDGSFDAVLSMGVLEHVQDPDGSLDELHRVLRPGGTLYVYKLPNRFSYLEKAARKAGLYYHGQLEHDTLYTKRSAHEIVERHGFAVRELRLANMLPLGITAPIAQRPRFIRAYWAANAALARVPAIDRLATNVELIARRTP
ncbi:MAG TPA: class I SAM-dependent methyltransferase [Capillimicrobium sp.]|jgi:2-polyprenyl-3-methyl-5-hydroxy-6-metoxy-1,4-benzoquinol methylase